ncbi:MAG TPA: glycosyltransferase [Solirubrobacteraceae bacterium]|nr:glycosyltransferase [Solirubrobacteraceae bacterium]
MRVLIFHGYLLGGTGSNVYNASLAAALARLGHDVDLLCQERHPERLAFLDAAGDWDGGTLKVRDLRPGEDRANGRGAGRVTAYRPEIGGLLPVYVADRYEGVTARTFAECSDEEVEGYIARNVAAVREVAALADPGAALANHLVMGPAILARGLEGRVPYAVKVHGSALEYTVKPDPDRFLGAAREGLEAAATVLVGSRHTAESLWAALGDPGLPARTRLGPPGVDVHSFLPRPAEQARRGIRELAANARARAEEDAGAEGAGDAFAADAASAAAALERVDPGTDRLVAFVGKLIVSKGVDLLLAAWPLVLAEQPQARLLVVGFGAFRDGLERLVAALAAGDLDAAGELARTARARETGTAGPPLRHLQAFIDSLDDRQRERYLSAAAGLQARALFTGRLEHDELAALLPACEALVVPSTFPESFGMVAAEAAACACLPVSAAHSGLAEVSAKLAQAVPAPVAPLLSFPVDDGAVRALAQRLTAWLTLEPETRQLARDGIVETVRERWSWEGVARGVLAAAAGRLGELDGP